MDLKKLEQAFETFLCSYTTDVSKIGYCNENGYPLKDALFDQILLVDFGIKYTKLHGLYTDWYAFNELLDMDNEKACKVWDKLCEFTYAKVDELLG